MEKPLFWGPDRVILQGSDSWRIVRWPDLTELDRGEGHAVAEPNGDRVVSWYADGLLILRDRDGERAISGPIGATPMRSAAWGHRNELLSVVGRNALDPPFSAEPSLLPVPASDAMLIRDGWRDSEVYAILEDEWRRA